jgi:UDP-2,3-diacylglucosamine pyrophosphatase LpxH
VKKPVHDIKAFDAMLRFARDYKPDVVLMMGDIFDMRPVSRHEIDGQPKKVEGQRLKEVYEKGDSAIIKPVLSLGA